MTWPRAALVIVAVLPAVTAAQPVATLVTQAGRAFSVQEIRVRRGTVVQFRNADTFLHQISVHAAGFHFASAEQPPGTTLDLPFPVPGLFTVRCEIHPRMALAVTVD